MPEPSVVMRAAFDGRDLPNHVDDVGVRHTLVLQHHLVELVVDAHRLLEGRELSELGHEGGVVLRLERVLILQLRNEQLEESVATHRRIVTERLTDISRAGGGVVYGGDHSLTDQSQALAISFSIRLGVLLGALRGGGLGSRWAPTTLCKDGADFGGGHHIE